jgi:hypothetical protein
MRLSIFPLEETPSASFKGFLFENRINRRLLVFTLLISILQFGIFKIVYPFPDFFDDSYSYIYAAFAHLDISIWPIGYSKFLGLFHKLTYSDTALVAFQYFLLQFACLYFYFTIRYFVATSIWTRKMLWGFLFVNPLSLYLCNLINSDALFAALTIAWMAQLIWMIQRPTLLNICIQSILLFLCFTVRNNAYYYPIVALICFLVTKQSLRVKVAGIILPFLLIAPFVLFTREAAYKMTGTRQFSLFSGWVSANNALYIYDQIKVDSNVLPTAESRELNRITMAFFKHIEPEGYRSYLESFVGNFFIKWPESPLKVYAHRHFRGGGELGSIAAWGKASAVFDPFGKFIITHYPLAYLRYFMWPNFWHYMIPPLSNLEVYDYSINEVDPIAKYWFHYSTSRIYCRISTGFQGYFLLMYSAFFLLGNLYLGWKFITCLFQWYKQRSFKLIPRIPVVIVCFIVLNCLFSVFATINIIRYQVAPMFLIVTMGILMGDFAKVNYSAKSGNKVPGEAKKLAVGAVRG